MTIDKIYSNGNLSARAYHICKGNGIDTIRDLKTYFNKNNSFNKFRNCGEKTSLELINLCNSFQDITISEDTPIENNFVDKINNLNRLQRQVTNQFIKITSENLKVRGRNAIRLYIGVPYTIKAFSKKIFERDNFQISQIKNIGKGTIPELETLIERVKGFVNQVSSIDNEKELIRLSNKFLIQNTFSINNIPQEILESQSIIKLCDFLISENAFFKEKYNVVFKEAINVFSSSHSLSLDELANELGYSKERVRQIRQNCYDEIPEKLSFLKIFDDDLYQNYQIDINDNFIIISDDKINEINFFYDTKFSKGFLSFLLSIYLSEQFILIGNLEDVLIPKQISARERHNWKNAYLIKHKIEEEINIAKFCDDISIRLKEKIRETYKFNFKSYISRFLTNDNFRILDSIKDYCETIINEEFDVFLDLEENIVFKRNTKKMAFEYAYEALEKLGKPSKVAEINLKIKELFPDFKTDERKVRASLKRKDGFVPIGRKSIYGLRKWENELANFKGGTIRSIVREYLVNSKTPKHINDITNYVLQFRPKTNEYSVLQNLKLDESKIFKFYKNSHIGLNSKKYSIEYQVVNSDLVPKKRSWEESYAILESFILENKRLPYSSNCSKNEEIIYRWFHIQKSRLNQNKLSQEKVVLINKILKKFPSRIIRRRSNKKTNFKELLDFISDKNRLPKPTIKEEQKLYHFFYRKRNLNKKGELSEDESILVTNILKQYSNQISNKDSYTNRYNTLLHFIRKNKRLPSAKFKEEQSLYQFFYLQRKLFKKDELDNIMKDKFLTIVKAIQNNKYENTRN